MLPLPHSSHHSQKIMQKVGVGGRKENGGGAPLGEAETYLGEKWEDYSECRSCDFAAAKGRWR